MANKDVKVLGFWTSPFSLRVEWALKLKSVDYEYIEEDIFNKSTQLLELNPVFKRVPVLVHDHKVIIESCLILEYIDETWENKTPLLMPQDPYERSMVRFWAQFSEEKIAQDAFTATYSQGDQRETSLESFKQALKMIEEILKGKKSNFFGGENIGYLDLVLGWIPLFIPIWEQVGKLEILNKTQFPAIFLWMDNFVNHPVIREKFPSREKLIDYFEEHKEKFVARLAARFASAKKE